MKKLLILALLVNLSFASDIFKNWTKESETKFYYFVGLQGADVLSTRYAINRGGVESNPLLGKNPSVEKLLLSKIIIIPVVYGLLNIQNDNFRKTALNVINVMYVGVVGNNLMVGARIRF